MKKGWKITLITLGSLLGLVVTVVGVALWLVFTPKQLTKIVNSVVPRFVQAETHFRSVDLTLLSTFPDAGLVVDDVYIVNPVEGAPSDTLARIGKLTVGVDVKAFLKENKVIVHQVLLDDAQANVYIGHDTNNFSIFPTSADTVDDDTTSATLPVLIDISKVKISNLGARMLNEPGGMDASVEGVDLSLKGRLDTAGVDARLKVDGRSVAVTMRDSSGAVSLEAALQGLALALDGEGSLDDARGDLKMSVAKGTLQTGGTEMVNSALQSSKEDLITLEAPVRASVNRGEYSLADKARLTLAQYALCVDSARAVLEPMYVNASLRTDGEWQLEPLLALVPAQFMGWKQGMDVDARVELSATAAGYVTDSTMPLIVANVKVGNGTFRYPQAFPHKVSKINGNVDARLDLSKGGVSQAVIHDLRAHTQQTDLSVKGQVDDLMGDMRVDATVKGSTVLADLMPFLDGVPLEGKAKANLDVRTRFRMSQLSAMDLEKINAQGTVKLADVDVTYDTIHAVAPSLDLAVQMPAVAHKGRMADVTVASPRLNVDMANMGLKAKVRDAAIDLGVNNVTREQLAADVAMTLGESAVQMDSSEVSFVNLVFDGSAALDSNEQNIIRQFHPRADIELNNAVLYTPLLPDAVRLSEFDFSYADDAMRIGKAEVRLGHSDFALDGVVEHFEGWIDHKHMLSGDLNFTSSYADVDQLMTLFSGMGSDSDSLELMRQEDNTPVEANPFIVPKDIDVVLHTHIKRSVAFGNDLSDVAGALTVRDGVAVLDQMGFVCKAATMQLTALYRSPRPSNLFASIDFHLLDIEIDELLDMIPAIDTLVPMLAAFDGNANFHLAGETYLDAFYHPKMPSLLGSAAISGKNLVVMDDANIANIAKLMKFKSWKERDNKIHIDSLDVELTVFDEEIEVFPFLLSMGKYQLCLSGKHTLENVCNYHIELLKNPLLAKVGVDVTGPLSSPKISLGTVRYADLYRPEKQGVVEKRVLKQKEMIRHALESNVR